MFIQIVSLIALFATFATLIVLFLAFVEMRNQELRLHQRMDAIEIRTSALEVDVGASGNTDVLGQHVLRGKRADGKSNNDRVNVVNERVQQLVDERKAEGRERPGEVKWYGSDFIQARHEAANGDLPAGLQARWDRA